MTEHREAVPRTAILLGLAAVAIIIPSGMAVSQAAPGAVPPGGGDRLPETPPEYRGAAQPLESRDTAAAIGRARVQLAAGEWGRGFASLDEVLERLTSRRKKRAVPSAAPLPGGFGLPGMAGMAGLPGAPGAPGAILDLELEPGEEVISLDGIRYLPAATAIRRLLLEVPPEGRAVYASTYEAPAREALEKARGLEPSRAPAELRRIGERWPVTSAAAAAWEALAERLLGAGRPAEAARSIEARLELPAGGQAEATALARLAAAFLAAGFPDAADRTLERLARDHADQPVMVRGEEIAARALPGHEFFRALRERAASTSGGAGEAQALEARALQAWVSDGGSFHHAFAPIEASRMPAPGSQAAWIHKRPGSAEGGARSFGGPEAPRAVSLGATIFIRRPADIAALDAATGKVLWEAAPSDITPSPASPGPRLVRRIGGIHYSGGEAAPCDMSLSLLPAEGAREALIVTVDRAPSFQQEPSGSVRYRRNALVAYSARTGKLAWTVDLRSPGEEDPEEDDLLGLAFIGPPVKTGDTLVAPASNGEALLAVGLTDRGKTLWTRRLFAWSLQVNGTLIFPGPALAAGDGVAGIAGGHGLVCAVDGASGEVLWESRYRSELRSRHVHMGVTSSQSPPVIAGAGTGAPVEGPLLLAAPGDSGSITAFDLRTGAIRWERTLGRGGVVLLGAAEGKAYAGSDRVRALRLTDGEPAWESEALGAPLATGIVGRGAILVATRGGGLATIDPGTGKIGAKLELLDPRLLPLEPFDLIAAGSAGERARLFAVSALRAFAIEPLEDSWIEIAGTGRPVAEAAIDGKRRFERVRLLRSEGRNAEALQALERLHSSVQSEDLKESIRADIISVSRAAAVSLEDPAFLEAILERKLVDTPRGRAELELLQANIIEKRFSKDGDAGRLEAAARIYLKLSRSESLTAAAPDGLLVDAGAYSSEALREMRAKLPPEAARGLTADAGAEESARAALAGEPDGRVLSRLALRRPHLDASEEAARRLVTRALDEGDTEGAAESARFLMAAFPGLSRNEAVASAAARIIPPAVPEAPAPGLAAVLASQGPRPLVARFKVPSEEGFIASTAPGSLPLPVVVAISRTELRLYDRDGKIILERDLPGYPDVSDAKLHLESDAEEPAEASLREDGLILFTAAGLYAFRGMEPGAVRPKEFRLAWAKSWPHPLATGRGMAEMGFRRGGMSGEGLFTEPVWTAAGAPLVLSNDWTLAGIDSRTGKHVFRIVPEEIPGRLGAPAGAVVHGDRVLAAARAPAGVAVYTLPRAGGGRPTPPRFAAPDEAETWGARLAAGKLLALFEGKTLTAVEAATGRLLWTKKEGSAGVAFTTEDEVWLNEPDGRLVVRSLRTGRERRSVELPGHGHVVDVYEERDAEGRLVGRALIVSRNAVRAVQRSGRSGQPAQTGTDLHLVKLDAEGKKTSEVRLHEGAVAYDGCRRAAEPGRTLIVWNGEGKEGKWYTRAVEAGPGGTTEVLSSEIEGKGTGQSPRIAVLGGGLAVGNAGGFAWFGPEGEDPPPPPSGAGSAPTGSADEGRGGLGSPSTDSKKER